MGLSDERARGALRFSFGRFNTGEEVGKAIALVTGTIAKVRRLQRGDHACVDVLHETAKRMIKAIIIAAIFLGLGWVFFLQKQHEKKEALELRKRQEEAVAKAHGSPSGGVLPSKGGARR